jgi:AraC family transcriptional regulator
LSELSCRRIRNYVLDRLNEDLTLSELSNLVGLHPRHFSTLFRRAFGKTPHRYVIDQRLAEGARLLANGGQDIADIAFRVGFSSQSHFAAAFRQAFGQTPRKYAAERRTLSAVL